MNPTLIQNSTRSKMIVIFYFLCCAISLTFTLDNNLIIKTKYGKLLGVESVTETVSKKSVPFWAYLGIPYAEPPVGNLRFKDPQEVKSWEGVYNGTFHRNICTQCTNPVQGSENCLYLNIYTPRKPGSSILLPILVWIHGGAFVDGSGNLGIHGADRFLEEEIMVVTINYRLGIFGFLCTEDSASPGNYGLKDQIAALKWIQENIENFGGDPKKVTIAGESAGAASVHYLLQANLTKGLYRAAISESGSTLSPWALARNPKTRAFEIALLNLIVAFDTETLVEKLRNVEYTSLQKLSGQAFWDVDGYNGLPWAPCTQQETLESIVDGYSFEKLSIGEFNRVPILTGFNSNEARTLAELPYLKTALSTIATVDAKNLVPKDLNVPADLLLNATQQIEEFYFKNVSFFNKINFVHYASDSLFVRGIRKTAQLFSKYVPVYLYRFSFIDDVGHSKFIPEGAAHTEELQFLFRNSNTIQNSSAAILTQNRMLKLWTNFVKYLNPTPEEDPLLNNTKWPQVEKQRISYLDIGNNLTILENPEKEEMLFWDNLYENYGVRPWNTY